MVSIVIFVSYFRTWLYFFSHLAPVPHRVPMVGGLHSLVLCASPFHLDEFLFHYVFSTFCVVSFCADWFCVYSVFKAIHVFFYFCFGSS